MSNEMKSLQDWNGEGRLIIKNQRAKDWVGGVAVFAKSQTREMPAYTRGPKTIRGKPRQKPYKKSDRNLTKVILNGDFHDDDLS